MAARRPTAQRMSQHTWLRRVGWLLLIWAASVAALGVTAVAFRVLMGLAGMTA